MEEDFQRLVDILNKLSSDDCNEAQLVINKLIEHTYQKGVSDERYRTSGPTINLYPDREKDDV